LSQADFLLVEGMVSNFKGNWSTDDETYEVGYTFSGDSGVYSGSNDDVYSTGHDRF